ncbi:MAG TPA: hypothetical protein VK427_18295 [Kofleriaceae bacterium]|nr:hypothetical protein [Kofleriaceae bacterium]
MTSFKLGLLAVLVAACSKSTPAPATPITDPVPMTEDTKAAARTPATAMLAAYERARAHLAADELAGVPEAAREIAATATEGQYPAIARGAATLAAAKDLDAARDAFGTVSRELITLLASNPALAKGQHVFECPMVSGYRKWVQPSENLENPYMGKQMLACGGESSWK